MHVYYFYIVRCHHINHAWVFLICSILTNNSSSTSCYLINKPVYCLISNYLYLFDQVKMSTFYCVTSTLLWHLLYFFNVRYYLFLLIYSHYHYKISLYKLKSKFCFLYVYVAVICLIQKLSNFLHTFVASI